MDNNVKYDKIDKSKFEFSQYDAKLFDKPPETKFVSYYRDAWRRFKKNKASVVAACIILFLTLFSLIAPIFAPFEMDFSEGYYASMPPVMFKEKEVTNGEVIYEEHLAIAVGVNHFELTGKTMAEAQQLGLFSTIQDFTKSEYSPIKSKVKESLFADPTGLRKQFTYTLDRYKAVGFRWKSVSLDEYNHMKDWQEQTGKPLLFPVTNLMNDPNESAKSDADIWYVHNGKMRALNDANAIREPYDEFVPNYRVSGGVIMDWSPEGATGNQRRVRLLIENWFLYEYDQETNFIFGTDGGGRDIFIRLAIAIRTSMLLGVLITVMSFVIGSVIGAAMGYYGGWFDLAAGRFMEILGGMPGTIVFILIKLKYVEPGILTGFSALIVYFLIFGWSGDAGAMRNQFYRFKHQEYVLAARTLGAKDRRIMFKHILPNALGTIITGLALSIPGVIGLETTLAYLGILTIDSSSTASIGAMLSEGQPVFTLYPHIILFPLVVLSLLLISFNLFGNGLRDAFNPQLRGVEE